MKTAYLRGSLLAIFAIFIATSRYSHTPHPCSFLRLRITASYKSLPGWYNYTVEITYWDMETTFKLDTTQLQAELTSQSLPAHEKFGTGESYQFGVTRVELYQGVAEVPPVARIRMPGGNLVFSDISDVKLAADGGLLVDCAKQGQKPHCSITISKQGEIAFLYTPPPPPVRFSENGIARSVGGIDYRQSTIDIEGTAEGVRVQIKGMVDAAPRLIEPKNPRSPLAFFLIEDDPKHPDMPVYHEVWAVNKPKQDVKAAKLTKGSVIDAVLYRHTFEVSLGSGEKKIVTRHNLVKIIHDGTRGRGRSAKRQKTEQ